MSEFEYIVVGGGSAGTVVASRLSEDEDVSVLLLEAGKDWRSEDAPDEIRGLNFYEPLMKDMFVWPDLKARFTPDREPEPFRIGKGLGGGSTVNGMVWTRPPPADFDRWKSLGCDGWTFEDVLPYFKKSESDELSNRPYHGGDGPVPIRRPSRADGEWGAVDHGLYEAARELGHEKARDLDFNAPGSTGISTVPYNVRDGQRVSTNDAYLEPARERDNLTVVGQALVDTVVFDDDEAEAVRVLESGDRTTYNADTIVLCAGAINTPGILLRSGIGPVEAVESLGQEVIMEHPGIGRLIDHPLVSISFELEPEYRASSDVGLPGSIFLRWDSGLDVGVPDDLYAMTQNVNRFADDERSAGALVLGLTHVYSEGTVTFESHDPRENPSIDLRLLSDRRDLVRLREGVRHVQDLLASDPMSEMIHGEPALGSPVEAGIPLPSLEDDADLEEAMLETVRHYFHPVGTCKMGPASEDNAVVDTTGRVHGVSDLCIADASIMPDMIQCNTNATAVMIGERIADSLR